MDYKAIAQQTAEQVLAYNQDLSGWKVVKTSKKVTVSSKASRIFLGNLYRIEGIIPESTAKLSDFLYQPENRVTWDKSLKGYNVIHKIDSDTFICHTITQSFAMGSISSRDFIDLVYIKHYEGNTDIISTNSVDFPGYPPSSHYIRGYNHPSGYVCSPLKEFSPIFSNAFSTELKNLITAYFARHWTVIAAHSRYRRKVQSSHFFVNFASVAKILGSLAEQNRNPAYSKLVMFVQTEMRGKLPPSIVEKSMPSNLVTFFLNAKDGIKSYRNPPARGRHHAHSSVPRKK